MIRFAVPALLALIPAFLALSIWLVRRERARYLLRAATILLVFLAFAGPEIALRRPRSYVYFLVDRSASIGRTVSDGELFEAATALAAEEPTKTCGLIEFASVASVVSPLGSPLQPLPTDPIDDSQTNVGRAIELALSLMPPGAASQLVLLTDGRATDNLRAAIGAAQLAGASVSVLPIGGSVSQDAVLVAFRTPSEVAVGRPFALDGEIEAVEPSRATVVLYRDRDLLLAEDVMLEEGRTRVSFSDTLVDPGSHVYRLVVKADEDPIPENDQLSRLVRTTTRPPILLIDRAAGSIAPALLEAAGLGFVQSEALPSLETLSQYSQLILSGVPFDTLTGRESADIERFARNLGGGVLLIQGEQEVRGFAVSPIEDLLPVAYSVPEKEQEPSLGIVYLLDRSSSMRALTQGVAKIRILRNAAAASITLLPADTLVGVVAFDDVHQWMIPMGPVGEGVAVYGALRNVRAEGGTDIYYPLDDALSQLIQAEARSKHMILITDGKTTHEERDYPGLLDRLRAHEEITLSAIALGETPNLPLLGALVDAGRGALYYVTDFLKLPQLTMQVTQRLSRSRFITGSHDVAGPLIDEASLDEIPPVDGYVLTYPRASARTGLWVGDDPLFSTWRVGLGSVSVLNTDLAGRWSREWVGWTRASALFEALLRATAPMNVSAFGLRANLAIDGDDTNLTVDAREATGELADFLDLEALLLPTEESFPVPQVGPGLYHASFPMPVEGGYALQLSDPTSGRSTTVSFGVPYEAEYRTTGVDRDAIEEIAAMTGGVVLERGVALPADEAGAIASRKPIAQELLLAALALFLIDLVARKLPRRRTLPSSSNRNTGTD